MIIMTADESFRFPNLDKEIKGTLFQRGSDNTQVVLR